MSGFFVYDGSKNEVYEQDLDISFDRFCESKEDNFFHAFHHGAAVTVVNPKKEQLVLRGVTVHQAIILFATVLGLKEAARE